MNTIKTKLKTPANRILKIKVPDSFPINEPIEVIINHTEKYISYQEKIEMLISVKNDALFLEDMLTVNRDYETIDFEGLE